VYYKRRVQPKLILKSFTTLEPTLHSAAPVMNRLLQPENNTHWNEECTTNDGTWKRNV